MAEEKPQNSKNLSTRDKLVLAGLYLSKFGERGVAELGFKSFVEVFNVIGLSLSSKPASVKNYRDEFDPLFPNGRKGWHKRTRRQYCIELFDRFSSLDLASFTGLIVGFISPTVNPDEVAEFGEEKSSFARRLITGVAAENYFQAIHKTIAEFRDCDLENTTGLGCGYDFKLHRRTTKEDFFGCRGKRNERFRWIALNDTQGICDRFRSE